MFIAVLVTIAKRLKPPPMDMVYKSKGMLFSLKKERNSDTCYIAWMNHEHIMRGGISQAEKDKHCIESTYMRPLE